MGTTETSLDHVRTAVTHACTLLADVEDPAERDAAAVALGKYLREQATAQVRAVRQDNARALRDQGLSLAQIGVLLSLDRNHVGGMILGRSGGKRPARPKPGDAASTTPEELA